MSIAIKNAPSQELINEGNYAATITAYGYGFYVQFVEGELIVRGDSGAYDRRPKWQKASAAKSVREFAMDQINALGEKFMSAHIALYEMA